MANGELLGFWKAVTSDKGNVLERLVAMLQDNAIQYCVIGGVAVNAYAEPMISLDFDMVITTYQLGRFESLLTNNFFVKRFPRFLEITAESSRLRVYVHTDSRYVEFVDRATLRDVLGLKLPIARIQDVLQGKIWACEDKLRKATKRQKDLLDIARLIEVNPSLRSQVPGTMQQRLVLLGV